MTETGGWSIARSLLSDKILELQMIGDLVDLDPQSMAIELHAKKKAAEILFNFLKNDIEGTVEQFNSNNNLPKPINSYIVRDQK